MLQMGAMTNCLFLRQTHFKHDRCVIVRSDFRAMTLARGHKGRQMASHFEGREKGASIGLEARTSEDEKPNLLVSQTSAKLRG